MLSRAASPGQEPDIRTSNTVAGSFVAVYLPTEKPVSSNMDKVAGKTVDAVDDSKGLLQNGGPLLYTQEVLDAT